MKTIITLLTPRVLAFKNRRTSKSQHTGIMRFVLFGTIGALFWGGIFVVTFRVLLYFKSIEELGIILSFKLLSMILVTFFSLLVFSSILTALSKLYLSRDLPLVHSMPVAAYTLFVARWIESTVDSSWMVIVYTIPVFLSYGIVFGCGPVFYAAVPLCMTPLAAIASGISTLAVMTAVMVIPASRIKNLFILLCFGLFLALFFAIRLLRPERLVDPEIFATTLLYLKAMKAPAPPYLPSTWAYDGIRSALFGSIPETAFHAALLWTGAATMVFILIVAADALYFKGVVKAQTAPMRYLKHGAATSGTHKGFSSSGSALFIKEIKIFFRDQTQWPQIFLIGALIVIYIYNFHALPIEKAPIKTIYLQNLLSFLNMGLAAFVLTAIAARFAFPAVSMEGEAFWIIKSAPVRLRHFLWIKFFVYFIPLLVIAETLIVVTNKLLSVTPFMMVLSTATIGLIVPGIVSMAVGFGAAYPDFRSENPAQSVTSFGGVAFMMACTVYIGTIILLEAGPVYKIFMAGIQNRSLSVMECTWTILSFSIAFALSVMALLLPMRIGENMLSKLLT